MKKVFLLLKIGFFLVLLLLISCENADDDTLVNHTEIDSTIYNVYLNIQESEIVEMRKIHQDGIVEKITIDYFDTIIQKTVYHSDTLIQKSQYYLNELDYALYSYDSLYSLKQFYMTYYKYNEDGYLIEEKNIPGYNYGDGKVDSIVYSYYVFDGNRYGRDVMIIPPNTHSTGAFTYQYTTKSQTYDLTSFNNFFLGKPNTNLPRSYGYQFLPRAGGYHKQISYQYEIENNIVRKQINDIYELWGSYSVIHREVLYYHFN